ncbi:MAG: DUF6036 family nucleotidyltransferase [Acidimicrobiales bacterium]
MLRAASRIAGERDVVIIGSQAILATYAEEALPPEAIGSIEADVCFFDDADEAKADQVDGAIGELSSFHEMFGVYAQGVSVTTAVLGPGWRDRIVVYEDANTEPGRGLCLEPHDLVAAKLAASREKDFEFAAALIREDLVSIEVLLARVTDLPVDETVKRRLTAWIGSRG